MSTRKTDRRSRPRRLEYLVIESVSPDVDGGRYPAKRIVGDTVWVSADIINNGPDQLTARVLFKAPDMEDWSSSPMEYDESADRWHGAFVVDRVGKWTFTIEASTDRFATWRSDLKKKVAAEQDVTVELMEGAQLARSASRSAKSAASRASLLMTAKVLEDRRDPSTDKRVQRALDDDFLALMRDNLRSADSTRFRRDLAIVVDRERARFGAWYEFFPRSHGTFADAGAQLPRIAGLGFDVIYLPPIHPIGRTSRKGKNGAATAGPADVGSPWAIGNEHGGHTAIDPALGTIDDFDRFAGAARDLGMEIALDYALQCSPDHPWVKEHPDWFYVRPDRSIRHAGAGARFQDIHPLNFWCDDREALWNACRDVVLFWIERGVKIFVADNAHTKPSAFWEWMIHDVQHVHPDVIFVAATFTRPKRMQSLAKIGFTMSYTYFIWRHTSHQLREYFTELAHAPLADYFRGLSFPNTPDVVNEYLVNGGRNAFRVRLLLAATLLPSYGIYSGFELAENTPAQPGSQEYVDSEKFERRTRDYDAPGNLNADIGRINAIRRAHAALHGYGNLSFHVSENPAVLFYRKAAPPYAADILVAVNTDPATAQEAMLHVPIHEMGIAESDPYAVHDLLTGARFVWQGARNYVRLDPADQPGHVLLVERGASVASGDR